MTVRFCRDCGEGAINGELLCASCGSADLVGRAVLDGPPTAGPARFPSIVPAAAPALAWVERSAPAAFYLVSPSKLAVMALATFGYYLIYWFYKQWRALQLRRDRKIRPVWRALFAPFFLYSLSRQIRNEAQARGIEPSWTPAALAVVYLICCVVAALPAPFGLVGLAALLVPVQVQRTILAINAESGGPGPGQYSGWNVAAIAVGALFWFFVLVAAFVPSSGAG
jgi:hypothetical protein